jgi:hypothetical protein
VQLNHFSAQCKMTSNWKILLIFTRHSKIYRVEMTPVPIFLCFEALRAKSQTAENVRLMALFGKEKEILSLAE